MIALTYKGQIINQRADGYVSATQMCQANGKRRVYDWRRRQETKDYIDAISTVTGIPVSELLISIKGGSPSEQGTWIHPKLAICLGRWVSVEFAVWCDEHIKTLITQFPQRKQQDRPANNSAVAYIQAARDLEVLQNPIIKSLLEQRLMEELTPTTQLATTQLATKLSAAEPAKTYVVVSVRASQLGYSSKRIGNGSALGRFIRQQGCEPVGKIQHGKYQVNTYEATERLDNAIHAYFS